MKQPYDPPLEDGHEPFGGEQAEPRTAAGAGAGEGAAPGRLAATTDGRGFVHDPTAAPEPQVDTTGALGGDVNVVGADGQVYLADYARDGDGQPRVRYAVTVIETKVPYDQRPTRGMLDTVEQETERRYSSLWRPLAAGDQLGAADAPDDDPRHGVGVESWWRGYFTETEVAALRAASSTRAVSYETRFGPL